MARMYEAECLRDCVQDTPYRYFKAGETYTIPEDCPVAKHFRPLQQLSKRESERIEEEGFSIPAPDTEPQGGIRVTVPKKPKGLGKP